MTELLPLPELKFATSLRPSQARGVPGDLQWIKIDCLYVDRGYQRDVKGTGQRNIRRIVEEFSWTLFSPLTVAPRADGRFAIIDGQHRAIAAKMHGGIGSLPCFVMHTDAAGEARAFAIINGNVTKLATHYLFRAKLAAGEMSAVRAERAAKAAGVRIMPYPVAAKDLQPNETLASGTIERAVSQHGEDIVSETLKVILATADGASGMLRAALIMGICDVLAANPKWRSQLPKVIKVIRKYRLARLLTVGMSKKANDTGAKGNVRSRIARLATAAIAKVLGDGKSPKKEVSPPPPRPQKVIVVEPRPTRSRSSSPRTAPRVHKAPARATVSEQDAIAEFIAKNGVMRVDEAASGTPSNLCDWLTQVCKIETTWSQKRTGRRQEFKVAGKRVDYEGLLQIVDRERAKRGLPPLWRKAA